MNDPFTRWTVRIIFAGLFLIFLVHFGRFVWHEVEPVIGPLIR